MTGAPHDLDLAAVVAALGAQAKRFDVDIVDACASTNAESMRRAEAGAPSGSVLAARRQTAGRGRLGRTWFAEPGASLTFSLLWRFAPGTLPHGLSLAVGVALTEALDEFGIDARLKWPNDLLRDGRKLAGVLVELVPGAPHAAVIGVGLNLRLPAGLPDDVRATAAALDDDAVMPSRALGRLLAALPGVLDAFAAGGFVALRERWLARCAHRDEVVSILSEFAPPLTGRCVAIDVDGALMIETPVCVQRVLSGEVSLRTAR